MIELKGFDFNQLVKSIDINFTKVFSVEPFI